MPRAVYLRISRGTLEATTVTLDDGRSYKRVLLTTGRDAPIRGGSQS